MRTPAVYEIRIEGYLTDRWSDWFDGLEICHDRGGETTLRGSFTDQSALFGMLNKLHSLNLNLISISRQPDPGPFI